MKGRLFTPGPTEVPRRSLLASAEPPLHPRSEELRELFYDVYAQLKAFFRTEHEVLTLTSSGTGAMEAAVTNFLRAGEKILTIDAGLFGRRWAELGRRYGLRVASLERPWGETVDVEELGALLQQHPDAAAVFLTYSETSTGVAFDIRAFAESVHRQSDALVIVDGISAVGVLPYEHDDWKVDVCVTASQKGAMAPPGLAFAAVGERAWQRAARADLPRYYFDFLRARAGLAAGEGLWTPASTLIAALRESLALILQEGLERRWQHYARLARATRAAVKALGLALFARAPSDALTAITLPATVEARHLVERLRADYGVWVAGGQDQLKGKIVRVAHMGDCDHLDMIGLAAALELVLRDCGLGVELGSAVRAMQIAYAEDTPDER